MNMLYSLSKCHRFETDRGTHVFKNLSKEILGPNMFLFSVIAAVTVETYGDVIIALPTDKTRIDSSLKRFMVTFIPSYREFLQSCII